MRAHRLLCSRFVSEDLFRQQIGGPRSELNAVMAYLRHPPHARPQVSQFFDATYYRVIGAEALGAADDPLLHFLETGLAELRAPHPLIDLRYIASRDPLLLGTPPGIDALMDLLDFDLAAPSPYFDPEFYTAQFGGAGGQAAPDTGLLRHFLDAGAAKGLKPNRWFDAAWYSQEHADAPPDPYGATRHFVILGDREGRSPGPDFDPALYQRRYADVAESGLPPLLHYLALGRPAGRPVPAEQPAAAPRAAHSTRQPTDAATLIAADADIRQRIASARARRKDAVSVQPAALISCKNPRADAKSLRFAKPRRPRVSVLIPVFNEFAITVECLSALAAEGLGAEMEIILADDASTDPDNAILASIKNITVIRHDINLGFLRSCNEGFKHCHGAYVLLLNNDTQVQPGAIRLLLETLEGDATIAAAGPKLIYPNGRLQEAGCAIRPNGESTMVGLFADPAEPGYNRDRDVAYCSGAALLVRRSAIGDTLFDDIYEPAYCEDADLCLRLRDAGHRIRYVHGATVVHHLSVSTNRQGLARRLRGIARNQHTLVERWGGLIRRLNEVRVLAFFLPQFHPTPENDLWWGKGFTEWTNVTRAQPSFAGHYQPHLPADLGFYDLRLAETLHAQAALARRYGVEGFVLYHYNFGKQRMLHRPLATLRANPDIDIAFCLCWANENWTRHWDGGSRELLMEQLYDDETIASVIADAIDAAFDPRAVTVGGKPMFLVYRPLKIPDPKRFARQCRESFARAGFAGVHLVYVESMEAVDAHTSPEDLGFDASVEFPPHGRAAPSAAPTEIIKDGWAGYRYDYVDTIINFTVRDSVAYARYPAIFPSWDNTARQPSYGSSFDGTPEAFRHYAEEKIDEIRAFLDGDERLLFVNAWNEWAEGAHLEPDSGFGHRWLEALRHALDAKRVA
jgi:GT2 family glycosyltransferase